jgi:hypothetical protein
MRLFPPVPAGMTDVLLPEITAIPLASPARVTFGITTPHG